ncbi:MAG TPA: flagellar hook capping FlgD N-terminal domain-containing protein [Miltoncostaeaceae bacterium]|nr:flagellar hook capping FlgD N-terminal domain-containing protein [Miltoncostaeaceae bacterium]
MADTTIPPVTGAYNPADPSAAKKAEQTDMFSSDGFLKLLASQIKGQNPLEPMKDTEFVAQMAQFSQLEQITNLAKDTAAMNLSSRLAQGASLVGKTVSYLPKGETTPITGTVSAVTMGADGRSMALTVNGVSVDAKLVTQVGA